MLRKCNSKLFFLYSNSMKMSLCPHENEHILEDFNSGTLVCMKCGTVLENSIFGRVSQEVQVFNVSQPRCKYICEIKNMAHVLNLKDDAVELASNLFIQYSSEKKEKKILAIVLLYYASEMLMYSINIQNFKSAYNNQNLGSIDCNKKFNIYYEKIDKYFKYKYKSFDGLQEQLEGDSSQFNYFYDLFFSFYKHYKLIYDLSNVIYTEIIKDLISKRRDVVLVSKSEYGVFLTCFINHEQLKKFNLNKNKKQELCNYFSLKLKTLVPIEKVYNAISQKF